MPGLLKLSLDKVFFRSLVEGTHQYEAFSKAQLDARMKQGTAYETRDIFASLLEARTEAGEALTHSELVSESSLLIVAGKFDGPLGYRYAISRPSSHTSHRRG